MGNKIPVGITIVASEQVTKVFAQVKAAMGKVFSAANQAPNKATASLKQTQKALMSLEDATQVAKPTSPRSGLKTIDGGGLGSFQKPAQLATLGIEGAVNALKNLALLLVGGGGITYGMKRLSDNISDHVFDITRLSHSVGVSTGHLLQMGYAARAVGVPIGALSSSLTSLAEVKFDQLVHRSSEKVLALNALNSNLTAHERIELGPKSNLGGEFFRVIHALQKVPNGELQRRFATTLLGNDEVLKFTDLNDGALQKLLKRFQTKPFDDKVIQQAHDYGAAIAGMDRSIDRLKYSAGADIMEGFSQGLEKSSEFIEKNSGGIKKLASDLGETLPKAIPKIFQALDGLANVFAKVDSTVGGMNAALVVLGTYTVAKTIIILGQLIDALNKVKYASLAASAVGLLKSPLVLGGLAVGAVGTVMAGVASLKKEDLDLGLSMGAWKAGIYPKPPTQEPPLPQKSESTVKVIFENAPAGMRILEKTSSSSNLAVELSYDLGINLVGSH